MSKIFKRSPAPAPLYYIYISQTKVEMLLPQLPASLLRSIEAEMKVNVAAFAVGVKKTASAPSPELTAKTGVLSAYLEKQEGWVGTVANPGRYVKGLASLQYGVIRDYAQGLAFFGGDVDGVKVGLIGSPESLIGATDSASNHSLDYYLLRFLDTVTEDEFDDHAEGVPPGDSDDEDMRYQHFLHTFPEGTTDVPDRATFYADQRRREVERYEDAVERALRPGVLPHQQRLAFLAKTLFHSDELLVATPIYVAMAD